ncbi:LCP family protein [Streptomyces sp. JJ66]|uniref:LCP family protein n=1 Tax=Streptomyces sp. JJ66 TaxID=2803843 RepID=UPI0027E25536|nr:LCP family protein [Streptomyces sp. JJ66]
MTNADAEGTPEDGPERTPRPNTSERPASGDGPDSDDRDDSNPDDGPGDSPEDRSPDDSGPEHSGPGHGGPEHGGPERGADGTATAGRAAKRRRWLKWGALGAAAVVLASAGVGWALYATLEDNITTDNDTARILEEYEEERPEPADHEAKNILIVGSDSRRGSNTAYGEDSGTARSDTTILLHLAADRESATAVSIPRDLMVTIPACTARDGARKDEQFAQFNWAYQFGGAACTIRAVEELTDIRVDHHMVIDFTGFKKIVNAVGGVEVCLPEPVHDRDARLKLPAGRQTLNGAEALGYVRARYTLGNGSDTQRMTRQQEFLASLFQKVRGNGVLMNPAKLYPVLDAATSAVTADPGLNSLAELYDLVRSVRDMPEEGVSFLTVPRQPYSQNPNRDELTQPEAERLFTLLRADRPVEVGNEREAGRDGAGGDEERSDAGQDGTGRGEEPAPSPTYRGSTGAEGSCG